jgi:uncharacterized membrane protein YdfJ with MMPL/SSD domain
MASCHDGATTAEAVSKGRRDVTQYSEEQVQALLNEVQGALDVAYGQQKVLHQSVQLAGQTLGQASAVLAAVADQNSRVEDLKSAVKKYTRIIAGSSLLLGIGCLISSWQLGTGFWPLLFTAVGSAFLTFVLINVIVERGISLYTDPIRDAEAELQRVIGIAGQAEPILAGADETLSSLPVPPKPPTLIDLT